MLPWLLRYRTPPEGPNRGFASTSRQRAAAAGLPEHTVEQTVAATLDWWRTLPGSRRDRLEGSAGPTLNEEKEARILAALDAGA